MTDDYMSLDFCTEESKGMKMLKMLGFKEGEGLGKQKTGIVDPILTTGKKRISEKPTQNINSFRNTQSTMFTAKTLVRDIEKSRKLCFELDSKAQIKEYMQFWPLDMQEQATEFEDLNEEEKLSTLIQHLRNEYNYCLYCGCIIENCPGPLRNQH